MVTGTMLTSPALAEIAKEMPPDKWTIALNKGRALIKKNAENNLLTIEIDEFLKYILENFDINTTNRDEIQEMLYDKIKGRIFGDDEKIARAMNESFFSVAVMCELINFHKIGPAIIHTDGTQYWYLNGKIHRVDRPAIKFLMDFYPGTQSN